jgi:hypothetical protein
MRIPIVIFNNNCFGTREVVISNCATAANTIRLLWTNPE